MGSDDAEMLTAAGREQYGCLLQNATDLLRSFTSLSPKALEESLRKRQNLVETLQNFDKRLNEAFPDGDYRLAKFREFQEMTTKKILETDRLLIALAREKQATVRGKLAALSKSAAFQAYGKKGTAQRPWLNDEV